MSCGSSLQTTSELCLSAGAGTAVNPLSPWQRERQRGLSDGIQMPSPSGLTPPLTSAPGWGGLGKCPAAPGGQELRRAEWRG